MQKFYFRVLSDVLCSGMNVIYAWRFIWEAVEHGSWEAERAGLESQLRFSLNTLEHHCMQLVVLRLLIVYLYSTMNATRHISGVRNTIY